MIERQHEVRDRRVVAGIGLAHIVLAQIVSAQIVASVMMVIVKRMVIMTVVFVRGFRGTPFASAGFAGCRRCWRRQSSFPR